MRSDRLHLAAGQIAIIGILLGLWELAAIANPDWQFFIASPRLVFNALAHMCMTADLYLDTLVTGGEALAGLLAGTSLGAASGLLLWYSPFVGRVATPLIIAIGAFPVLALAPLMILWFGIGIGMKIALAIFSTYFLAFTQAFRGAHLVNSQYLDFLQGMRASRRQLFTKVIVPGSLEWVFNSMRVNVGLALLGAFIGEFIASNAGLGHRILRASSLYDVPNALGSSLCIVLLSLILDGLGRIVEKKRYAIIQNIAVPSNVRTKLNIR